MRYGNLSEDIDTSYQNLKTMVKRSVGRKLWSRSFHVRHGRIETGAVVKIEREWVALKEEKVLVTSGEKKASVRRDTNAFSNLAKVSKSLLDGRDHLLVEARCEFMKEEYKVDSLVTCISDFQQLCSVIGIGGRPSRTCRISKKNNPDYKRDLSVVEGAFRD